MEKRSVKGCWHGEITYVSNCLFCVGENCLRTCLLRTRIRCASRRYCMLPSRQVLEAVRKLGLEGIVSKRIDSIYEPGERAHLGERR